MRKALDRLNLRLGDSAPIWAAFFGSLVLSLAAIQGSGTLNNDGMLYVETARSFVAGGYAGAFRTFDWPLLSLLMAWVGQLSGIGPESAGHLINAMFLAGTCALMVDLVGRRQPEAVWAACLVVLSLPGVNGYRDQLLREYGCWFFSVLAFWLAAYWERDGFRWRVSLLCQVSLICAVLFRFEAVLFFPALVFWQLFSAPKGERLTRTLKVVYLPITAGLLVSLAYVSGLVAMPARLMEYVQAVDISATSKTSQQAAKLIESGILPKYSRDYAGYILFTGLLAVVPLKFFSAMGIFSVPFVYVLANRPARETVGRWAPLTWAFFAHLIALAGFAVNRLFVLARHAGPLALLAVPVVAEGVLLLLQRSSAWRIAVIVASLLTMASNVVTFGPGPSHIHEAAAWLQHNVAESDRVYVEDPKVTYRAGWRQSGWRGVPIGRPQIEKAVADGRFHILVLSQSRKKPVVDEWIARNGWKPAHRFENEAGDAIIVVDVSQSATHRPGASVSVDSSTAKSVENTTSKE